MPRYPSSIKAEAIRLVKEGATQRTVARKLKVPEGTLSRWLRAPVAATKRAAEAFSMSAARVILSSATIGESQKVALLKALLQ